MTVPSVRPTGPALARRLGLFDAVIVGAGSMIGAGVFSAWGPAADAAGAGLLVGLVIAAVVAFCNATSSAQLAAVHPESGGTYVFARRQLSPAWGHLAGWSFVVGKTASCVALALTAGEYLWPEHARPVGILAVAVVAVVNIGGLSRTVGVTKCLLVVAISALAAVIIAGWSTSTTSLSRITPIDTTLAGALRVCRLPVLRLRRVRPNRNARRRGSRPSRHDPQGDPAGARCGVGDLRQQLVSRSWPPFPSMRSRRATHRSTSSSRPRDSICCHRS